MATRKRTAKRTTEPEAGSGEEKGWAAQPNAETICVAMDARQKERIAAIAKREPLWGRTQCVRHIMNISDYLEQQLAALPAVEAYAVQHHMTLPAARRKVTDWEWMVDALCQLAKERLAQLESRGKLPPGQ